MTLSEARDEFLRAERAAVTYPTNAACQRTREQAYEQWLWVVRYWRLSLEPPLFRNMPGIDSGSFPGI